MNPLLLEPDLDQSAVLNAIFGHFEEAADWPIWQGVDRQVGPPGTAVRALKSMPVIRETQIPLGWRYGWVRWDNWGVHGAVPYKDTKVQMTVAGIWALKFSVLPELYVQLLGLAQERRNQLPISFTDAQQATITSDEMRHGLFPKNQWGAFADRRLVQLRLLVEGEGPCPLQVIGLQDGSWAVSVDDNITDWAGVETVVDYVNRMMQLVDPSAALPLGNQTLVQPAAIAVEAGRGAPAPSLGAVLGTGGTR